MSRENTFSIPAIRSFVPERMKPFVVLFILIVFQFSGGVSLSAVSQMVGSLSLMQEDVMMAGYASMAGMTLVFACMFRLKFRFTSQTAFITCGMVIIACNLICIYCGSVPILVAASFLTGIFRMWASFECNSTLQLWITPRREMPIFFCYVNMVVQGCMQLSGLTMVYFSYLLKWQWMHWFIIGMLGIIILMALLLFRPVHLFPRMPLYGIDWLGALLWGIIMLCIIFICLYGEHYEWWQSWHICGATMVAGILLLLNLWRASFIRHPFISLRVFHFRILWMTWGLWMITNLLFSPQRVLEPLYLGAILRYDALHVASLNWVVLAGTLVGAWFTWRTFALRKWRYKTMTLIAFAAIAAYLCIFYFTADYNLPKSALYLPVFLRSFAYIIVAIVFYTSVTRISFDVLFQSFSAYSFISVVISGVAGTAIAGHLLQVVMRKNFMQLGAAFDRVNLFAGKLPAGELYGMVQRQAIAVSVKEIFGWMTLLALFCLLVFLVNVSKLRPQNMIFPTYRAIRRLVKRELTWKNSYK